MAFLAFPGHKLSKDTVTTIFAMKYQGKSSQQK
jgi:hypothetical protein